jgi:hypothetical protein
MDVLEIRVMTLQNALKSCREGDLISHKSFDQSQFMFYLGGQFYYEDGACLEMHMDWLKHQEWAQNGWYVKCKAKNVGAEFPAFLVQTNRVDDHV